MYSSLCSVFGVARFVTATASASLTVRGTPTYMAPEQWAGRPVPASDQYALAIMSYELLTGHPPFQGQLMQVMYQHTTTPPAPPSTRNSSLAAEMDTVLLHALAKKPEERFASMTAFANAFQQAVHAQAVEGADAPTYRAATSTSASAALSEDTVLRDSPTAAHTAPTVGSTGQQSTVSNTARPEVVIPPSLSVSPTEAATPASQGSFSSTAPDLAANPSVGQAHELILPTQAEQRASVVPPIRSSQPPAPVTAQPPSFTTDRSQERLQPAQRGISRRTVVVGLAGLAVVGVAGSGLLWLAHAQPSTTPAALPTSTSASAPLSVETTLYTYRGHSNTVWTVGWSLTDKRIASGSGDGTVQIWDATTGGHVFTYRGHRSYVQAVAWSPDGKHIASGSNDRTVQVWDTATGGNVNIPALMYTDKTRGRINIYLAIRKTNSLANSKRSMDQFLCATSSRKRTS